MSNIRKGDLLDISPTSYAPINFSHNVTDKENKVAVLNLGQFSRPPHLSFGAVKLGTTRSEVLYIHNPIEESTDVVVDKVASAKGFSVDQTQFSVPATDCTCLTINWTPVEEGNVRELVTFVANGITKHRAILLGRGEAPKKKKKSLWDSIKQKKATNVSAFKEKRINSSVKKTANKTFHVSRQPQYQTERMQSPLTSNNEELVIQEKVSVFTGPIENQQKHLMQEKSCTPVPLEMNCVTFTQTRFESVSSQKNSPVVLLVPAAKLFEAGNSNDDTCAVATASTTDHKNVTRVLNTTCSPTCTPEHSGSRLMPHIQSSLSPISSDGKVVSCVTQTLLPGAPVLSVKEALAIIQSDLIDLRGASPPNACSSFDFSDSLESIKENSAAGQSFVVPEVNEKQVQEMSIELETMRPGLTFFVKPKSDQVNSCGNEANDADPINVLKLPFSSSTVTKSRVRLTQESSHLTRKTRTSKRLLMGKTLELSGDDFTESSIHNLENVSSLPVMDAATSHDTLNSIHGPLVSLPSVVSPVRYGDADHFPIIFSPGVARLDLSPIRSTPSTGSVVSVRSDLKSVLNVQQQSAVTSLIPHSEITHLDLQSGVAVPAETSPCRKKRKSDEFLADRMDKGKIQAKKIRILPVAKEAAKPIQDGKLGVKSTSQRLHRQTVVSQRPNLASSKPTRVARSAIVHKTNFPSSKSVPQSLKSSGTSSVKMGKVVAVAQAHLNFITKAQTVIPRHPLPFAAKNMFYDERWYEKQERGFIWWLNYLLTPDDFKVSTEVTKVCAVSLALGSNNTCPPAPTKEEISLSMYTARRRLNSLRRAACKLFTSATMVKAIQRLELEIEAKRLLVRKDRHLWKDIGERQKILTWLLSYNPLWLRIGLETIFGELIPLESNSDVTGLAVFILNRLLWNPDIAAEFRHPKVPHLYRDGHEEALSQFTLKKLLLLVCFLDKAKESRIIEHDPCLFCKDAEFKTSKDLLLAFARDFLSGEGILSRHLGYLGLAVSHAQVPLDEFSFAVKNLASDLKCGIRLVRVMELLTQDWSLSRKLRMPAVSRLQKVHNVELALEALKAKGVNLKDENGCVIDARDIVDAHREKTLALLWKIIFAFQVEVLLDEELLKEEIRFLKRTWRTRQKLDVLRANHVAVDKPEANGLSLQRCSEKLTLLMDWVNAVSSFYNTKAENFTVSFSDGQILCYLIHHYHPSYLPLEAVHQNTTQTVECAQRGRLGLNCSSSDSDDSLDVWPGQQTGTEVSSDFSELLENEKSNFQLVDKAVCSLGGVPAMIHAADVSNTIPSERVVICYLSFLCARLLDLRNETRAARTIQEAWRKYRLKNELKRYEESNAAATTIQSAVRRFLQKRRKERWTSAVILIQTGWRSYSARKKLQKLRMERWQTLRNSAAIVIQAQWRKHLAMKKYQKLKYYTVRLQACLRMKMTVTAYKRILWAARTIQKRRRAWLLAKQEQQKYLALRCSVIKIQKCFRQWRTRSWIKKTHAATVIQTAFHKWHNQRLSKQNGAAIKIQSWYRMVKWQKWYASIQQKTIYIQAWYRGNKDRRNFQHLKLRHSSAIVIQRALRVSILRRKFTEMRLAAVVIQQWFRACRQKQTERQQYLQKKHATVILQAAFRGHRVRKAIEEQQRASVVIQSTFRMFRARKSFLSLRDATLAVQRRYRAVALGQRLRKEYFDYCHSIVVLQALWRGRAERKRIEAMDKAALLIQSCYRRFAAQSDFKLKRRAALIIQNWYRACRSGRMMRWRYLLQKKAAISLQAGFRGMIVRQKLRKQNRAATLIQAAFKAFACRQHFLSLKSAAVVLQTLYRAHLLTQSHKRQYILLRQMSIRIQAVYRGTKERRSIRRMHQAATTIQACYRRHKAQVNFAAARCAASVVQQHYRACIKGRHDRRNYLKIRNSVTVLQSAYRGMKVRLQVRKMHRSATVIQANYRRHMQVVEFQRLRWATSVVCQRFRANQERNVEVSKFMAMKKAAVCIQSAYRGVRARKRVKVMQEAARVIQLRYVAYREHKAYLAMKSAAVRIQRWYRALFISRLQQKRYNSLRAAAITVQSVYRGMNVRREVQKKHEAATVIQAVFRMYRTKMAFKAFRLAATIIQKHYKAHLYRRRDREHFLKLRCSAIVIQSVFRGNKTRNEMRNMHSAATVIQSQCRMYLCHMHFKRVRWAAIIVQERYRACRARDALMLQYRSKKTAVVVIQRAFRGYRARQQMCAMHRAATVIQRQFCTFRDRKHFLSLRAGVVLIQQRYRALVAMRTQRKEYLKKCKSAIVLQAAFRGMKVRQHLQMERKAAVVIQARVRRYLARSCYNRLRWAAKIVQRNFRTKNMIKVKAQILREKLAVTRIQAAFRAMKTRKHIKQMHKAACTIQSHFRANVARKRYLSLKSSVLTIQRRYRSVTAVRQQKGHYRLVRCAAITLQAAFRGHMTRKEMRRKHAAATVLQAEFRKHRWMVTFRAMRLAAVIIQRHYRSYKLIKRDREKFLMIRNYVITIQAAFRGQRARQNIAQQHKAAMVIQSSYRMHRQREAFRRARWAATILQQKFRAQKLRDSQVLLYQQLKWAVVCIQASFRRNRARQLLKRVKAALKIQSYLRMYMQRRSFLQQRAASVVIQSAIRRHLARVWFTKMRTSSVQIQRWYRSCRLAQKHKAEYLASRQAIVTLQSAVRGMLARKFFARWRAQVKIQSVLQMVRLRKWFLNLRSSTVKIQSWYRMWRTRRRFLSYRAAALTLQKHFRAKQEMKARRLAYLNTRKSVLTLQAAVRGYIEYKNFKRLKRSAVTIQAAVRGHQARLHVERLRAAQKIQSWFRGKLEHQKFIAKQKAIVTVRRCIQARLQRKRFLKMQQSVCIIQRRCRGMLAARRARQDFLRMRSSTVKIQTLWRGYRIRLKLQKEWKAACLIQASYRAYVQRKAFQQMKKSVLVLQSHVRALLRGKKELETFWKMKTAAITLQAFCRGWLVRRRLKEEARAQRRLRFSAAVYHNLCAIKIQRGLRAHWALKSAKRQLHYVIYIQRWIRAKLEKKRHHEKMMKVRKLQKAVRGWLSRRNTAATVIQRAAKKYLSKKREQRVELGILKAQALWRGHQSRKTNDTRKVVALRNRLRKINLRIKEEDRLCNKTTVAIDYLLRYTHFSYIIAALKNLETATRLSSVCCERLVNSGATQVIFALIRSCNRSIPCMEVITLAIQVLLNLSKYNKTAEAVYAVENSVNTLLDLLQIYREKAGDKVADKGGSIFTKTCFLLSILLQDEQRALEVRNLPKAADRIRSLCFLTARKHKMDTERTVTKLKMNASLNGSFFSQPTPQKAKARPRIAPDWVLRRDNMK
ncbi:hypothetical protein GJAV_G00082010 [Gymnothorax javanicus]|nr:hypothetical protein GJAV_G00082010 [Gymnothorax javanicus]